MELKCKYQDFGFSEDILVELTVQEKQNLYQESYIHKGNVLLLWIFKLSFVVTDMYTTK